MNLKLLQDVETRMLDVTMASSDSDNAVLRAVHHHFSAGGSRVRARISLYAGIQMGLRELNAVTVATICELLHNASLVQDDLIDRASPRRGVPSVWAAFDDATAICAGDHLLAAAFASIADLQEPNLFGSILRLVHQRTRDVILGQAAAQNKTPRTLEQYERFALGKSASLLSLPLELPLLLSNQSQYLQTAQLVAHRFAIAYQMADDLEDYEQDLEAGSLNAVSVLLDAGATDVSVAKAAICSRAADLLEESIRAASELPCNCAGVLLEKAYAMLKILKTRGADCLELQGAAQHAR